MNILILMTAFLMSYSTTYNSVEMYTYDDNDNIINVDAYNEQTTISIDDEYLTIGNQKYLIFKSTTNVDFKSNIVNTELQLICNTGTVYFYIYENYCKLEAKNNYINLTKIYKK